MDNKIFMLFLGFMVISGSLAGVGFAETTESIDLSGSNQFSKETSSDVDTTADTVRESPNHKTSKSSSLERATTTTQGEVKVIESSDVSLSGRVMKISPLGSSGMIGKTSTDSLGILGAENSWKLQYTGLPDDSFYILNGTEYIGHTGTLVKRFTKTSRDTEWKIISISGGYKIVPLNALNYCISWSNNGQVGSSVSLSVWKTLSNQTWTFTDVDANYSKKVFYVPINTKETISSGSGSGSGVVWYKNNSKVEEGTELHVAPNSGDISPSKYEARRGDEVIRSIWVVPEMYNFGNQEDYNQTVSILSPVDSWTLPRELKIPETTYRYNDRTETLNKYKVTDIANGAFAASQISTVNFPMSLEFIGVGAFDSSAVKEIGNISSSTVLSGNAFRGTEIDSIVTDDPDIFVKRASNNVFNNYMNRRTVVWKKGNNKTYSVSYSSGILSDNILHEGDKLSLSLNVGYPTGTKLRYPLNIATTTFKDSTESWQAYHTYQWYKDGEMLTGETNPMMNLSNLKATDSGIYYALVDGQRVEGEREIKVQVKVDNTNPASPEPSNPDSWLNVDVPVGMEFHSTSSSNHTKIEGNSGVIVNHSGRSVKVVVSNFTSKLDQNEFKGIKSLNIEATKGSKVDLENYEDGKEVDLVTLGNIKSSTNRSQVSLNGLVDTEVKQESEHRMNLGLKFIPLDQSGKPY